MDDNELIELYLRRDESAISCTEAIYGSRLRQLADRFLADRSDTEECLNDTYLKVWNAIPPHHPDSLYAFCAAICRTDGRRLFCPMDSYSVQTTQR